MQNKSSSFENNFKNDEENKQIKEISFSIFSKTLELVKEMPFALNKINLNAQKLDLKLGNETKKVEQNSDALEKSFENLDFPDCSAFGKKLNEKVNSNRSHNQKDSTNKFTNSSPVNKFNVTEIANSQFKSPATPNVVNLRINSQVTRKSNEIFDENSHIVDEAFALEDVFAEKSDLPYKHKRKSSTIAETNVKKRIEREAIELKNEEFVKRPFDELFCGIAKDQPVYSKIFNLSKSKDCNSPLKLGILCDKTNSPIKPNKQSLKVLEPNSMNSAFFLPDDLVENNGCEIENETEECEKYQTISKSYTKAKFINTRLNEGYLTVIPKRKAVIDLFNCPKAYFRKNNKDRKVYFDFSPVKTVHNPKEDINSIFIDYECSSSPFEWTGEKEIVEIVKRIDLGSDSPTEEFIYRKVDKSIEF